MKLFHRLVLASFAAVLAGSFATAHDGHSHEEVSPAAFNAEDAPKPPIFTTRPNPMVLPLAKSEDVFHFVVYGDRTGGVPEGLKVLEQAVVDTNLLDPDLVMTVGDLIQGYNEKPEWMRQMTEYKDIMDRLRMRWFPVAGNHDVYWRGKGPAPQGQHESNYEKHFGPLWYSFAHKNAAFIVLYSDEGDDATNTKGFNVGALQQMSDAQLAFLDSALAKHHDADHIFLFLHHPRWIGGGYEGSNWDVVHEKLKAAGNVSAVFAGHIHHMRYDGPLTQDTEGPKDTIEYFTLATTGGHLAADIPGAGYLHHLNIVSVRPKSISVAALPVGSVMDPKEFTPEFLADIEQARTIRPVMTLGQSVQLATDGSASGELEFELSNPSKRAVDLTVSSKTSNSGWMSSLDHDHVTIEPGQSTKMSVEFRRRDGDLDRLTVPQIAMEATYRGESARIQLPTLEIPVPLSFAAVPADYFTGQPNHCLRVQGESSAIRIASADLPLADGPMTVETWLNPDKLAGYCGVVAKTQMSEFAIFMDEGVPQFDLHVGGAYRTVYAKDVLTVGQWTHVAGVFDGSEVRLYVDGKLVDRKPAQGTRRTNELPLFIGADTDGAGQPTRPFVGKVDEVRLSKAAIYSEDFEPQRRPQPSAETVLLMHLDQRLGPYVLDHSDSAAAGSLLPDAELVVAD